VYVLHLDAVHVCIRVYARAGARVQTADLLLLGNSFHLNDARVARVFVLLQAAAAVHRDGDGDENDAWLAFRMTSVLDFHGTVVHDLFLALVVLFGLQEFVLSFVFLSQDKRNVFLYRLSSF
jgi:hypothetical protein